jgi:hypothetical protein
MKFKQTSDSAENELSDQALLGVVGGADANSFGGPTGSVISSAALVAGQSAAPYVSQGPDTGGHPTSASITGEVGSHSSFAQVSHAAGGNGHGAVPTASNSHAVSLAPAAISHAVNAAPAMISHAISHGPVVGHAIHSYPPSATITHGHAPSHATALRPLEVAKPDSEQSLHEQIHEHIHEHVKEHVKEIHDRFEHAAQEIHEGFHDIIEGAAEVAHGFIDMLPGHHHTSGSNATATPPPASGIHIFRR